MLAAVGPELVVVPCLVIAFGLSVGYVVHVVLAWLCVVARVRPEKEGFVEKGFVFRSSGGVVALQVGGHYTPRAGDVHFRHVTSGACMGRERIPTPMLRLERRVETVPCWLYFWF